MTEFVALRAKMYAYRKLDEKKPEGKRCKGTKKCVVAETLTFEDYKKMPLSTAKQSIESRCCLNTRIMKFTR